MIPTFFIRGSEADRKARALQAESRLRLIRDYWTALVEGGGGSLPARAEISPRGIEAALSQAFLVERVAPGTARLRVAGMDLNDLMGMEVRGMPLSCLIAPGAREAFGAALEQVLTRDAILEAELEAGRGFGQTRLAARLLILPLAPEPDGRRMALGGLAVTGAIGAAPRRFDIARQQILPALPDRQVLVSETPIRPAAPAGGTCPDARTGLPPRPRPGKPHLWLVKSG